MAFRGIHFLINNTHWSWAEVVVDAAARWTACRLPDVSEHQLQSAWPVQPVVLEDGMCSPSTNEGPLVAQSLAHKPAL